MLTITQASRYTGLPTSVLGHASSLDPPRLRCFQNGPRGRRYYKPSDLGRLCGVDGQTPSSPEAPSRGGRKQVTKMATLPTTNESEFGGKLRVLGYMPDGHPIYPITGSEGGRGYSTAGDIITTTIDGRPLNDLWTEFQQTLEIVNSERRAVTNLLCFRTDRSADGVAQTVGDDDFELASEFGEPTSLASKPEIITVGYPFHDYDKATRFTWKFLRDAPASQVEEVHARALYADNKLTTHAILRRLLDPTEDINSDGRTVYGLYNGDAMLPPRYGFHAFTDPHSHYLTTGSATPDGADLDAMIAHITEHGYATTPGSQLVLFLNPDELPPITQIRADSGALEAQYDFIPGQGAPAYLTDQEIIGDIAPGEFNRLKITGSYGPVWIAPTQFMPPGYLLMTATGGGNDSLNPVGFREHINPAHRGLRLLPGARSGYPLVDSFYTRGFGVGVRHRGAAVAMQITTDTTYDAPVGL